MKIRASLLAVVSLALGFSPALATEAPDANSVAATALGDEGNLYQVVTGTFGDLSPKSKSEPAGNPVLALDVTRPDGTRQRTLVPGTEGHEVEGPPSVVFEDASERLYAVWESKRTPTVSRLLLASFGPDGWSEPIEISGDVAPLKDEPRILIGRDRFAVHEAPDELQSRNRTVIHVLWREEGSAGSGLFYTPVILEAGKYVGWNPVVALADLEPELTGEPEPEAADLLRNPVLAPGQDIYSAIIAFASPASGRMITVEARLLPGELGFLADDIRGDIIEIGSHDRGAIATLAKSFAAEIVETAHQLNSDVVQHFADLARAAVVADYDAKPDQPPGALADHVRADIIEIGDRLLGGPGPHGLPCELLEVGPGTGGGQAASPSEPGVTHLVRLRIVADRPAPPLDGIPGTIFVSEDGERLLVGWLSKGKVYYTESGEDTAAAGEVWTAVKHLTLTERLGLSEAAAILEARVKRQR